MEKVLSVAIIGCGARGMDSYGKLMLNFPQKYKIVSICDKKVDKLNMAREMFNLDETACFLEENEFFKEKRAELLLIATQDDDHYGHILRGLETGYDILVEKPLTSSEDECRKLLEAQKTYNKKIVVCHLLRYAPAFVKLKELLDNGVIGKLVSMNMTEQVGYWHMAHSYVRGNWRNDTSVAPMILAKCCHDLDLIQYYAQSKCKTVSSVGELTFFKKENQPNGANERCMDCQYMETCPYSAKRLYVDMWKEWGSYPSGWPFTVITNARPLTEEALMCAIREGDYGKCVFCCDNNVVDHQETMMTFENGVKATLHMEGLTAKGGRRYIFYGTYGEIDYFEDEGVIKVQVFGTKEEIIKLEDLTEDGYGHGGGDVRLIERLYDIMIGEVDAETTLDKSIESHLIGIKAEQSRLLGGKTLEVHE